MSTVSLAEAKAHLSDLVARAEAGEEITVTRHGKAVARIVPEHRPRKPISARELRAVVEDLPPEKRTGGEFMRWVRDTDRY